jgi:hypothetical protein
MKGSPVQINLDGIWADLGVRVGKEGVRFDDGARFAAIRRAITSSSQSVSQEDPAHGASGILAGRMARELSRRQL